MDDPTGETAVSTRARRLRQGEAFWREMVVAWTASGLGARRFCRERGLAVSTSAYSARSSRARHGRRRAHSSLHQTRHLSFPIRAPRQALLRHRRRRTLRRLRVIEWFCRSASVSYRFPV
jgi:hypothetical protein